MKFLDRRYSYQNPVCISSFLYRYYISRPILSLLYLIQCHLEFKNIFGISTNGKHKLMHANFRNASVLY